MPTLPTFNGFSLNDGGFITERIVFKGFAQRAVNQQNINRREGIKLLSTEFGAKEISVEGSVTATTPAALQALLDTFKKNLTTEEGSLVIESGRTYRATAPSLVIPDEHYNQSKTDFECTFICTDPFSTGASQTVTMNVPSGLLSFSGYVNISGTFFVRPTITFTPPAGTGHTNIKKLAISHIPTGQQATVSGFGNGTDLAYGTNVIFNYDNFTTLEGATAKDNSGSFSRWEAGDNNYIVTFSGRSVGGTIALTYQPRYI